MIFESPTLKEVNAHHHSVLETHTLSYLDNNVKGFSPH
jgi:hypothetical protein